MKKETKLKKMKRRPRNPIAKDLRTPKYKERTVKDRRQKALEEFADNEVDYADRCCTPERDPWGCSGACTR